MVTNMRFPLRLSTLGLLVILCTIVVDPVRGHHSNSETDYVLATGGTGPFGQAGVIVCQSPPSTRPQPFGIGGACSLTVPAPPQVTIRVTDQLGEQVRFFWSASDTGGNYCLSEGDGTDVAVVTLRAGCTHLSVAPYGGSLAGHIKLT